MGVIFLSQFLETQNWEKPQEKLQKFWTDQLAVKNMDISEISKPWYDKWKDGVTSAAPEEAARRYYSVKNLLVNQLRNNMYYQCSQIIEDNKFFDHMMLNQNPNFLNNDWILHTLKAFTKEHPKIC